ncbi:hypothetical protein AWR38_06195 [Idiomarina sp. WRN-38]|nr:hypothetical protein AUR68_06180 [Idiomarina sp. H105]OAE91007.1 hypothetical protein AWR38_06195 [Idiomarina sp. WRN-38]
MSKTKLGYPKIGHGWLALLLVIGVVLLASPHIELFLDKVTFTKGLLSFLGDLGASFIIGVVLVYTLELFTRKRQLQENQKFIDEVNKNVLASVYKRIIPESSFKEVEDTLLNARVERTNYEISLVLKEFPSELADDGIEQVNIDEHFLVHMHSSYTIRNLSSFRREHPVLFGVEVPVEKALEKFVQIDSFNIDGEEYVDDSDGEDPGKANLEKATTVTLEPYSSISVKMQGTTVKRKIDSEVWASIVPSDGVVVRIEAPNDIELNCRANHSKEIVFCEGHEQKQERVWKLEHGILPYQSIVAWWNGSKK